MSYSLNETYALTLKAARGAGLSWGMAEEIAFATRWLCYHGLDGCKALAQVLDAINSKNHDELSPNIKTQPWKAVDEMSPLFAGVTLQDRARILVDDNLALDNVSPPMFLLPFVAHVATIWQSAIEIQGENFEAQTDGVLLWVEGDLMASTNIQIQKSRASVDAPPSTHTRAEPTIEDLQILNSYAAKTYAPTTEASRLKGAGAGVTDND